MKTRLSLKQVWISLILFAIVVPTTILMIVFTQKHYAESLNDSLLHQRYDNELSSNKIESQIQRLKTLFENKSDPLALLLSKKENPAALIDINLLLHNIVEREPAVRELMILSDKTEVVAAVDPLMGVSGKNMFLAAEVLQLVAAQWGFIKNQEYPEIIIPLMGRHYIGSPKKHDDFIAFSMSTPIGMPAKAVLVAIIDVGLLQTNIQQTKRSKGDYLTQQYILDRRGSLLTEITDSDFKIGDLLTHLEITRTSLINGKWASDTSYIGVHEQPVFGTITTIPSLNWTLVSEISASSITQPIVKSLVNIALLILLGMALFVWFVMYLVSKTLKPIQNACEAIEHVSKGDYQFVIESSNIHELNVMTAGFNNMAKLLNQSLTLKTGQQQILELISRGSSSLLHTFEEIISFTESQFTNIRATILFVKEGKLIHGAAPSMPKKYIELINGLDIGPRTGSCGTAAFRKERVIVEDVNKDPLWADYQQLGQQHNFRACWSEPVFDLNGEVVATFAIYQQAPGTPDENEIHVIEAMSRLVSIAIERKQSELKLIDAKKAAEASTIAKSQFLATMSHEIRTPMNGVLGMAQLLEETTLTDEQRDYLDTITSSGNSLLSIINNILDFSKLDAGKADIESISFDLERVCQESLEVISGSTTGKELELIFDYAPDAPRFLMGDPARIRQILLNFLSNANKFTHTGYIRLKVFAEQQCDDEVQLIIEVEDTGIGIKPEAIENLFNEFTQADVTTTRKFGGTGLGLAITKKIASLMGGEVGVTSEFGKGSTFSFKSKFVVADSPAPLPAISTKGIRILLVDHHLEHLQTFKHMLQHMGTQLMTLSQAGEVATKLHQANNTGEPVNIVILGDNMSTKRGLKLGRELRSEPAFDAVKLLILATAGQKGDAAIYKQAGFDAYLSKLCRYQTLQAILSEMLSRQPDQPIITQHFIEDRSQSNTNNPVTIHAATLVVEDVLANQLIAKKFLNTLGATVDIANNGLEAIQLFKQNDYDLIFMDCRMPLMDGYEATREIRKLEKINNTTNPLPIIALTANVSNEDKLLCHQSGMNDIITKPFKRTEIAESLQKWLPYLATGKMSINREQASETNLKPVLDNSVLVQLKLDMDDAFDEVLEAFHTSMKANLDNYSHINADTLQSEIIRWMHSIKSISANFGAIRLSEKAAQLESDFKAKKEINISAEIKILNSEYQQVLTLLQES